MATSKLKNEPTVITSGTVSPFRGLVYADPKVGKTTLGLSLPRPLVINTDFGLEGDALTALLDREGLEHSPEGHKDLEALFYWCRDHADMYDSIFIDSGDELVRDLMDELVAEGKGGRSGSSSGALGQTFFDVVPEQAEYLANQRQMHTFLTSMRHLRKHMLISFGVREGAGTQGRASFNTTPGLQKPLMHWASVYGRLLVAPFDSKPDDPGEKFVKGDRVWVLDPGSKTSMAGTRYSALAPHVVIPQTGGFDKVWALMNPQNNTTN